MRLHDETQAETEAIMSQWVKATKEAQRIFKVNSHKDNESVVCLQLIFSPTPQKS